MQRGLLPRAASPHRSRSTVSSPTDAVRHWPAKPSHLIQDVAREDDLSPPPCGAARSKAVSDDRLVAEERVLHAGLPMIARRLLPASPSSLLDRQDRAITSARPLSVSRHVGRPRRRNHDGRATRTGGLVKADRLGGGIRRHPYEGAVGRLDQRESPVVASSTLASVRARATITPDRSTPRCRVFQPRLPRPPSFAAAHSPSPTIESPVLSTMRWQAGTGGGATKREVEMLATPGERGVIGRGQVETQHPEDRRQEAFSLPQGQVEDEPERQRGFDGEIGILQLPATFADAHGLPSGDRIRGQPHGDIASLDQHSVVCRPIPDVVLCRVLWVHAPTSCRDHAPAVATMARRSIVAHRGRGIRAPTQRRGPACAGRGGRTSRGIRREARNGPSGVRPPSSGRSGSVNAPDTGRHWLAEARKRFDPLQHRRMRVVKKDM